MHKANIEGQMYEIKILNWDDKSEIVKIPALDLIEDFTVYVISGDELFSIVTKYGDCYGYDAAEELNDLRIVNFNDGCYTLIEDGVIDNEAFTRFLNRNNSYQMFDFFEINSGIKRLIEKNKNF